MLLDNLPDVFDCLLLAGVLVEGPHRLRGVGATDAHFLHHNDLLALPGDLLDRLLDGREKALALRRHPRLQRLNQPGLRPEKKLS